MKQGSGSKRSVAGIRIKGKITCRKEDCKKEAHVRAQEPNLREAHLADLERAHAQKDVEEAEHLGVGFVGLASVH